MTSIAEARRELEIAGDQLKRDLQRDPALEKLVEKLSDANASDVVVTHWVSRINAHLLLRRLAIEKYQKRRAAARAQIIFKTHDPQEIEERHRQDEKVRQRLQRHQKSKAAALRVLRPAQRGLIYKVYDNG